MKLLEIFSTIPDFRRASQITHALDELLVLVLCAVLSGANDFVEIEEYGKEKFSFLSGFLPLTNGIASHDTIRRVIQNLETASFKKCLLENTQSIVAALEHHQINIDGKVLKSTGKKGKKNAAICIVNAWSSDHGIRFRKYCF